MNIRRGNPPIYNYDKVKITETAILDILLEKLKQALEKCIQNADRSYPDYHFYWYEENKLQECCKNQTFPSIPAIVKNNTNLQTKTILGYHNKETVYINLDAFPFPTFSDTIATEYNKIPNIYMDLCNTILQQI